MKTTVNQKRFSITWKIILAAAIPSFFMAFSSYLLFLQPAHVISKTRLLMAAGIWLVLFAGLLILLGFDPFKWRKQSLRITLLALVISLGFSAVFFCFGLGLKSLPYNLLLLPQRKVEIQPVCQAGSVGMFELKYFIDGIDVVSYSAFEKQGSWERTADSLLTRDCSQARLTYRGWLVEKTTLAFRTRPDGSSVNISWDGTLVKQDLTSKVIDQVIVVQDLGIDYVNKTYSLIIFLITFAILLFPLVMLFAREIVDPAHHTTLKDWFEETAANLRPLLLALIILSVLASVGLFLTPWLEQDDTPVRPANPASQEQPNVILIIADSLSAEDMSLFGYSLPTTPNLERVTRDWTIYTNANTSATCTIAIYPSLNTGRYPIYSYPFAQYGEQMARSADWVSLLGMMSKAGYNNYWNNYYILPEIYHSAQGIDDFLFFRINNPLFRTWFQTKSFRQTNFPHYPLLLQLAAPLFGQSSSKDSPQFLGEMLIQNKIKSPFFIYMHYRGAHFGSYYAGKYLGTFLPKSEGMTGYYEQNELLGNYSLEKQPLIDKLRLRYDEAVLHEDDSISGLIDKIKKAGIYDSSMIIVAGDHGQVFDNGYSTHCTPLISYAETHIPLLIKYPHQTEGKQVDFLTSLIDLTPTILETANIHYENEWFDGLSLVNHEINAGGHDQIYIRSVNDNNNNNIVSYAVMNDQYKLTRRDNGYFLYNYRQDPREKQNLIQDKTIDPGLAASLRKALDDYIAQTKFSGQ
jgi:arylsulfatase A-like enzyme